MAFIDDMRAEGHAVESTCRVLREQGCPVAARTYRAWRRGCPPADRTVSDAVIMDAILATAGTPEELYGRRKMTHHLRRTGHQVAFCTVDRIMAELGRPVEAGGGGRSRVVAVLVMVSRCSVIPVPGWVIHRWGGAVMRGGLV